MRSVEVQSVREAANCKKSRNVCCEGEDGGGRDGCWVSQGMSGRGLFVTIFE